ncbi:MAG: RnfABCDGE type electron transport complex subunit G [Lachnospiraceae bacterium]|nr:RnfABCDGE type electron transport complex subunit G [Candidatus Colinaster equi]
MKEMMKNALILFAITVIAGAILGGVYEMTKDTIADRQDADKKMAYEEVLPGAADFKAVADFMPDNVRRSLDDAGYAGVIIDELNEAVMPDGTVGGYVFTVISKEGYGGDIKFTVGISVDGTVNGISILEISETAGLGMNAEKQLKPQFAGKNVSSFSYTKTGATLDSEIDAISGATITTRAFVNGVNCCLQYIADNGEVLG